MNENKNEPCIPTRKSKWSNIEQMKERAVFNKKKKNKTKEQTEEILNYQFNV